MSDCSMHGMFARKDGTLIDDPREPRPVATARYELYWAWCLHYNAHSQILLIDSRDTLFQRDPFIDMKPSTSAGGVLRLYGVSVNLIIHLFFTVYLFFNIYSLIVRNSF